MAVKIKWVLSCLNHFKCLNELGIGGLFHMLEEAPDVPALHLISFMPAARRMKKDTQSFLKAILPSLIVILSPLFLFYFIDRVVK
jgi:hypothetical protein